jgi:hypothetical protein
VGIERTGPFDVEHFRMGMDVEVRRIEEGPARRATNGGACRSALEISMTGLMH